MRVISGTAKGRKLISVSGMDTRPTTDRVKESIFNIIQFDIEGARVLDLFAGTGQMGIEALSRGAKSAVFVDVREECVKTIQKNLQATGFSEKTRVVKSDYRSFISEGLKGAFDLVFLDPPYKGALLNDAIRLSTGFDILYTHGIILCESGSKEELPDVSAPYEKGREYRYGNTKITLYTKTGG